MVFWFKANIPTIAKPHVVAKLKSIHKQHVQVSKHRSRKSATQHSYQEKFTAKMNTLFDIAHGEWDCLIKINEDKQFLIGQRGSRKMLMTSEDLMNKKAVVKYRKCKLEEKRRFEQHKESKIISTDTLMDCNSDYSLDENSDCDMSIQTQKAFNSPNNSKYSTMGTSHLSITISKCCIFDNQLFQAVLDRTKIIPGQAMMVATPALAAIGIDVNKLTFSRSTLMEARTTSRKSLAIAVRKNFQPLVPLVTHFDGKMLSNVVRTKRECLPIVVSGLDIEKLLGIPEIPAGTGTLMGQKVVFKG